MNLDKFYRRKISISEVIDCASGDVFMDVYDDLDERYPNFTKDQFIDALNYYMDNDDYIEF